MHKLRILIIFIGIFGGGLSVAQESGGGEDASQTKMVIVEPTNVITSEKEGDYKLVPYVERRGNWGYTVSAGYSTYEPINYEPNFVAEYYENVYKTADVPMIELRFSVKRNMPIGSLGSELSVGITQNDSDNLDYGDSSLQLIPVRLGLTFNLDTLTSEPYVVPYVSGGGYIMMYKESLGGNSFNGNSQIAGYMSGGVAFQLDWLDRVGSRNSYEESQIESTFAYAEALKLMSSGGENDPDFSNDISWGAGLRLEF